jgi:diguanylate cyclase (GGDEF)-like protein/PAS domain S-box-containing protein
MDRSDPVEQSRLALLKSLEILDTPPEEVFDRLTHLAAHICEVPMAAITLIDERRQWFKSSFGWQPAEIAEIPRDTSLCAHILQAAEPIVVPDIRKDERFMNDPYVTDGPALRFYACAPLTAEGGYILGALAVFDHVPRTLTRTQIESLQMLADQVVMHFSLRRQHMNPERLATERAEEKMNLLTACIERMKDALIITDAATIDGAGPTIIFVNQAFEHQTGYRREEILGSPPRVLAGPATEQSELDRLRAAARDRLPVSSELVAYRKNGDSFWSEVDITPIMDSTGRLLNFVAVLRDVTERKKRTESLATLNRALQMHTRCNEAVIKAESEQQLLEDVCRIAVDVGRYYVAWVGYAEDDAARSIKPVAHAGPWGEFADAINVSWSADVPEGGGPAGRAVRDGRPVVLEDVLKDPCFAPWYASAQRHGYKGVISLPLQAGGRTFGVFNLLSTEVRTVPAGELELLRELADNLAFGVGHRRAKREREEAQEWIRMQASLLDKARDAILVCDTSGHIRYWNKSAERIFGWTQAEAIGRTKQDLVIDDPAVYELAVHMVLQNGDWIGEIRKRRKDGSTLMMEAHWTLVKGEGGQPDSILAIDTDITHRKAAEREIERLAFFDPLTRLPNRRLLMDRLQHALAAACRSRRTGALLFIDLDNFKSLNDTLGHDKGDQLLEQVARRLEACVPRKSDTVARLGGDEFVVMLEDLSQNAQDAAAQADSVGEKIISVFTEPFHLDGYTHHTTPSIGVTLFNKNVQDIDELLKRADLAMYQSKASGRNTIRFFDPDMQAVVTARVSLESDLRQSLQQQDFHLQYQRQANSEGRTIGAEALVRWRHPRRGMVSPALFIPLAEETGMIIQLGQWVLETACAQLAAWQAKAETSALSVAVNVSLRQFRHPDFVNQVLDVLERTGASATQLKLELTESVLIENVEATVTKMTALKEHGVCFSLDDFGTGYSSLSYLKRLPLDQLKIDQSFVRDVLTDSNDAAIARTIVALGQTLGLDVIAEGVETTAQRDFLARNGCHAYQGYLFSPPLTAEQFVVK